MNNKKYTLLHTHKMYLESIAGLAAAGVATAAAGAVAGAMATKAINNYKNKYFNCKMIKDPVQRDRCTIKIIDSMIDHLKSVKSDCENTPDPAQCKLDLINKIEKLLKKKYRIETYLGKMDRKKLMDDHSN